VLKNYPSVAIDYVDTYSEALMAVSAGKADATVATLGSALYDIAQKGIYNLQLAAVYEEHTDLITFGVRKDWPELVSIFDKALAAIPETTKIQIINKWMPPLENRALSKVTLTEKEHDWIRKKHSVRVRVPTYPPPIFYE
jgi:ABC-type amino acid transport substrate-binding protein